MRKPIKRFCLPVLGALLASGIAAADTGATPQIRTQNDVLAVDEPALTGTPGNADIREQRANVSQGATLGDNQLTARDTGSNAVSSGAFSNMAGIAHVIQNTGNNVIIQDSTTFNVQFIPNSL